VDGIYGSKTEAAVRYFQRKNGLTADGIAGPQTLAAIAFPPAPLFHGGVSNSDYNLLARIISAEARGEPYTGQVAVGAVILNRVEHPSFPDSIPGVIYQPGAFTAVTDGQINATVLASAYRRRTDCLNDGIPAAGPSTITIPPRPPTSGCVPPRYHGHRRPCFL
jgi:N-acetylmuramoyl-L-alanine amidase